MFVHLLFWCAHEPTLITMWGGSSKCVRFDFGFGHICFANERETEKRGKNLTAFWLIYLYLNWVARNARKKTAHAYKNHTTCSWVFHLFLSSRITIVSLQVNSTCSFRQRKPLHSLVVSISLCMRSDTYSILIFTLVARASSSLRHNTHNFSDHMQRTAPLLPMTKPSTPIRQNKTATISFPLVQNGIPLTCIHNLIRNWKIII